MSKVILQAEREVAFESPDHVFPWGTKRDNSRNRRFNRKLYKLFAGRESEIRVLDIGCSGGGFVRDCFEDGCLAVGLEGSDYSKRRMRAEWRNIPEYLFTCDVTRPFSLFLDREGRRDPLKFHVITSWDVVEHIAESDLPQFVSNVTRHLERDGLWVMSVSPREEVVGGVRLHQTVRPRDWWIGKFGELGLDHHEACVRYFNTQFVRGPKYGSPGSFHLVLSHAGAPCARIPAESRLAFLYDRWLNSRFHRFLKSVLLGKESVDYW